MKINSLTLCLVLSSLTTLGCCEPSAEVDSLKEEVVSKVWDLGPSQANRIVETVKAPFNCPMMLVAHSNFSARENLRYLSFSLQENPNFDSATRDACEGDIKNLWPDLIRFDAQIEAHMPNIYGIQDVDRSLKYFQKTEREFKRFIDDAANDAGLHETLDALDRSTLEGGMEIDQTILRLIRKNEQVYFAREHTPIIESTLSKHGLKMRPYETEKMGYCYYPYNICRAPNYDEPKAGQTDYKLERLSPGFSWYQFEKPD